MARRRPPAPPPAGDVSSMPDELVRPPRNRAELHSIHVRRAAWMAVHGVHFTYTEMRREYLRRQAPHLLERNDHA